LNELNIAQFSIRLSLSPPLYPFAKQKTKKQLCITLWQTDSSSHDAVNVSTTNATMDQELKVIASHCIVHLPINILIFLKRRTSRGKKNSDSY